MFGSRNDGKKTKRSFWPWSRRSQDDVSESEGQPEHHEEPIASVDTAAEDTVKAQDSEQIHADNTPEVTHTSADDVQTTSDAAHEQPTEKGTVQPELPDAIEQEPIAADLPDTQIAAPGEMASAVELAESVLPDAEEPVANIVETLDVTASEAPSAIETTALSQEPLSQEPLSQEPLSQESLSQEPISQEPLSQEPLSQEPLSQEPLSQEPLSQEPLSQEPPSPEPLSQTSAPPEPTPQEQPAQEPEAEPETKAGFFARMRQGLNKTRNVLVEGVAELFIGKKEIDEDLLDELETQLLVADVGVEATSDIMTRLTEKVKYKELDDADALMAALQAELAGILVPADQPLVIPRQDTPFVILVVGVNGVGKTTTIGKLARKFQSEGRKVMLAAGDTFRAAAVEQLQVWGERNAIPVIAQHTGADSASVIFDAFEAARARQIDVLIADTAGRLHNKDHLMEELKKVKRVLGKLDPQAPHEVLLVLDAGTGQNALSQARLFHEAVQLTGMALTKLDGTAKGGVIFALSKQMQLPIRFLGVGERIDDLRPFSAGEFVKALFSTEEG